MAVKHCMDVLIGVALEIDPRRSTPRPRSMPWSNVRED